MNKGDMEALKASAALAMLSKEEIGLVCISLASALTGAMVLDMKREGKPVLTQDQLNACTGGFLLAAIKQATGITVSAVPLDVADKCEGEDEKKEATPEAQATAERAMQDVLKRMKDGGSVH